jgi:hypothetical protein
MPDIEDAKLLRVHFSEGKTFRGKPLHESIIGKCREFGIAGASVFRGLEGFGETAEVHRHRVLHPDLPVVIVIVDEAGKLARLIPEVESMMDSGLIAISDVRARRVSRGEVPRE